MRKYIQFSRMSWPLVLSAACVGAGCTDAPEHPTDITVTVFVDGTSTQTQPGNADLVAFQDGDGAWTAVTGDHGVYHFTVTGDRYGVAVGCRLSGTGSTELYYQSVAEASELAVNGCTPRPGARAAVHVSVSHPVQDPDVTTYLWLGDSLLVTHPMAGAPFVFDVATGVHDIFARSSRRSDQGDREIQVFRGASYDVQLQSALAVDIDWSTAAPVEDVPLTIDGASLAGDWRVQSSYLVPASQTFRNLGCVLGKASSYPAIPAAMRGPDDVTRVEVTQSADPGSLTTRAAFQELRAPVALTLTPPPAYLPVTPPTIDPDAIPEISVTIPIEPSQLGYTASSATFVTNDDIGLFRRLNMVVRPGWAGGASAVTLRAPDLSHLAGWSDVMRLSSHAEVGWTIAVVDQNRPLDAPASDGRAGTARSSGGLVL